MTEAIQSVVRMVDAALARLYLSLFRERHALRAFLFHSMFRDEREIALNLIDPLQRTTVAHFRQFVAYYVSHGYRFVSPADVLAGLPTDGRYAMITFDDGYYNNVRALAVLAEFDVPATFFISTDHVRENRLFWWDVLYRELAAQGMSERRIYREALALKSLRTEEIERQLTGRFGAAAFVPRGDIDRPFTPDELREFARSPLVHLGNHTAHHAILTNYEPHEMRDQLRRAQVALREITGTEPLAVAYPNGAHDDEVIDACRDVGLKLGATTRPAKNDLPLERNSRELLRLGRFSTHGAGRILSQCQTYRSDLLLYGWFRDGYLRLMRKQVAQ